MLMMSGGVLVFFSVAVTVAIAVTVGAILASITDSIAVAVLPGIDIQSVEHHVRILDRLCRVLEQIVDLIEELEEADAEVNPENDGQDYLNIALPKGRLGEKVYKMFAQAGFECPALLENSRKLIFTNDEAKVRYFWVKPSDVSIYVERGAADIGVCGKDILLEYAPDVYELLDMNTGICRMAVAAKKDFCDHNTKTLKVATKFSRIARNYYASIGRDIDIIHLNGSIEIAPILGLSDVIVDIVETGTTLKENDLEVKETIVPISARLIANKAGFKFKGAQIEKLRDHIAKQIKEQ